MVARSVCTSHSNQTSSPWTNPCKALRAAWWKALVRAPWRGRTWLVQEREVRLKRLMSPWWRKRTSPSGHWAMARWKRRRRSWSTIWSSSWTGRIPTRRSCIESTRNTAVSDLFISSLVLEFTFIFCYTDMIKRKRNRGLTALPKQDSILVGGETQNSVMMEEGHTNMLTAVP